MSKYVHFACFYFSPTSYYVNINTHPPKSQKLPPVRKVGATVPCPLAATPIIVFCPLCAQHSSESEKCELNPLKNVFCIRLTPRIALAAFLIVSRLT